ncbi:DUF4365 domain-containing protein [Pseudonocardia sp.]|uniref:DUF4365 domain-containing protein n=1 Tax=Pseudonocardia sp. TaxID=60912 RepID=UPI002632B473|nr:DUF4365 domain-containing protein [Pseudonocardia sp.]
MNMVRALLEDSGHIVQEIDGGNDHGEDLYVRFVEDCRVTSFVIAVQVKSGTTYRRSIGYAVPVGSHGNVWRSSNMPIVGIVYDPEMKMLYWANMTEYLRENASARSVPVGESDTLTSRTVGHFVETMSAYIRGTNLQLRPERGQSLRAAVNARLAGTSRPDQQIGGNPNAFFFQIDEWLERNDRTFKQFLTRALFAVLLALGVLIVFSTHKFAVQYQIAAWNGWLFTMSVTCAASVLAVAAYHEKRAGRRGHVLSLLAFGPLAAYGGLAAVSAPVWIGIVAASIGSAMAGNGMLLICGFYVARESDRKRRVRAAYGDEPELGTADALTGDH